jgi:hypothetical protein
MTFSLKELRFLGVVKPGFVISLSGCVVELGLGGVERSTLARDFQCTKERWISLSGSKVMII